MEQRISCCEKLFMPGGDNQEPFRALPELIERLRPALRRLFCRQGIPAWDGEDLIQQGVAAALRRWPTIAHRPLAAGETADARGGGGRSQRRDCNRAAEVMQKGSRRAPA
jgi:hypothetical protein